MAIDWDRLVVESEHNGVIASAGEVALLVGADAAGVTWGNITGDITQQADLMVTVDGFAPIASPQFTGIPRTVTPPAGNSSTRIASTAYVQTEIAPKAPLASPALTGIPTAPTARVGTRTTQIATTEFVEKSMGTMAKVDDAVSDGNTYARKDHDWVALGAMAAKDNVDYQTEVINKPTLGALAAKEVANYETDIINKPSFGTLASKNNVDYQTEVVNKPTLGALAPLNSISYTSNKLTDKPQLGSMSLHNEPPANLTRGKRLWARTNERNEEPDWEEFEAPDIWVDENEPYTYMRSSWGEQIMADENHDGVLEQHVNYYHGWKKSGSMALVDDVPEVTPGISGRIFELYFRTHGGWVNAINPTMWVDGVNGSDTNGDGTHEHPYKTIMKAVNNIFYRGSILIYPGTYNEDISIEGKVVTLSPEPYATGQLVQSEDAEDIVINQINLSNFASLYLDGNFKIVRKSNEYNTGFLRLQLGSTLIHRTGKLTIYKPQSYPIPEYWDRHAIWVFDSNLRVNNLDLTFGLYEATAIYVEGISRVYFDNILADCYRVSGTLFELFDGGIIQYDIIRPESVYAQLYKDNAVHALIGGL